MKQMSMNDYSQFCEKHCAYDKEELLSPLERSKGLFGSISIVDDRKAKEPVIPSCEPCIGCWIRTKNGYIYKIKDITFRKIVVGSISKKNKSGVNYIKNIYEDVKTYLCEEVKEGRTEIFYVHEKNISFCGKRRIFCIRENDCVLLKNDWRYRKVKKIMRDHLSQDNKWVCVDVNGTLIYEDEIRGCINPSADEIFKRLRKDDHVCNQFGKWGKIMLVRKNSLLVKYPDDDFTKTLSLWDICDYAISRNEDND